MANPFKATPEEITADLPINRSYRKKLASVSAASERDGKGRYYILDSEDVGHDFLPFRFIDTGTLLCGRKIETGDMPALPADPDNVEPGLCPECVANSEFWENMPPDEKAIDQLVGAIESTVEAKRQDLAYCQRAVRLIEELDDSEDSEVDEDKTTEIFKAIALAYAATDDYDDASTEFQRLSKRAVKKFSRWGYDALPERVSTALDARVGDVIALEDEAEPYNERISEFLKPWRDGLRDDEPEHTHPVPQPSISREERLARRKAEREEHQRRVDEAAERPIAHKPRRRNRELEAAIAKAQSATGEERVTALRSLRQIALNSGDDEWASYAKTELRGTRDCSP